jgi:LruC domain-containing protein
MKKLFYLFVSVLLLATACRKPLENASPVNEHLSVSRMTDIKVPEGFLWGTTKNIQIHIALAVNPYIGKMQQLFFYAGNPATGAKLLLEGSVSDLQAFDAKIAVPTTVSVIYMVRQTPDKAKYVERFTIGATAQINKLIEPSSIQSFGKNATGPDCNTGCTNTVNNASGNLSYSSGTVCLTGSFAIANLTLGSNVVVRVCGTGTISNLKFNSKNAEFIVTSSGNVTFTSTTPIDGKFTNYGTVATLGNSNFNVNRDALFTNEGTCHFTKSFNPNANSVLVNNGTIEVDYKLIHSANSDFTNNCKLIVHNDFQCDGLFKNYGYIRCDMEATFSGGINDKFSMHDGAMVSTKNIQVNSDIYGYSNNESEVTTYSLIKVQGVSKGNNQGSINGTIYYCDQNGLENLWMADIINGAVESCSLVMPTNACNPEGSNGETSCTDSDEDGICDSYDDFPNSATQAFSINGATGTIGYEDLWPYMGDYDMNDVVVNYDYQIITNAQNDVVKVNATYKLRATGGTYNNGFAVQFPVQRNKVSNVVGATLEAGQTKAVLVVFNNMRNEMPIWNTFPDQDSHDDIVYNVSFELAAGTSLSEFTLGPFNPFVWNGTEGFGRGYEVHLPGEFPTDLANMSVLGTGDDNTNIGSGQTYISKNGGYPWALHIPDSFEYPIEKADVNTAYFKFADWGTSGGVVANDWYQNQPGYREPAKIYKRKKK